jgi:hypothetical protein
MLNGISIKQGHDFGKHLQFVDGRLSFLTSSVIRFASLLHSNLQSRNLVVESLFKVLQKH